METSDYNNSGGSTDIPVTFLNDKQCALRCDAVKMIFDRWAYYSIGNKKIKFWGSERDLFVGKETWRVGYRMWLKNVIRYN